MRITLSHNIYNSPNYAKNNNSKSYTKTTQPVSFGHSFSVAKKISKAKTNIFSAIVQDIKSVFQNSKQIKSNFYTKLKDKYIEMNFSLADNQKESFSLVNEIFHLVKKPKQIHLDLTGSLDVSLSELKKIFKKADSTQKLIYIQNFQNEVVESSNKKTHKTIYSELLSSEHINEYIKNYNKYKAYFMLNKEKSSVVKALDTMVSNGSYSEGTYRNILIKNRAKALYSSFFPDTEVLNKELYSKIRTQESDKILNEIGKNNSLRNEFFKEGIDKYILNIFTTTTKDNIKLRTSILKQFQNAAFGKENAEYYAEATKLFNTIDNSKSAKSFAQKACKHPLDFSSIKGINSLLEKFPHDALNKYFKTITDILAKSPYKQNVAENQIKKMLTQKGIEIKNTIQYTAENSTNSPVSLPIYMPPTPILSDVREFESAISSTELKPSVYKKRKQPISFDKPEEKNQNNSQEVVSLNKTFIKKMKLKENVVELISKKLGSKTLADQKIDYTKYATKTRFDMLPEIFASIIDTRKADRLQGKKKSISSNFDAVELFKIINGKNKKLINYLLKKRDDKGFRMFEVKEIIDIIKNAEETIRLNKNIDSSYTAKQAKEYYNYLYDMTTMVHGKLKKETKQSKIFASKKRKTIKPFSLDSKEFIAKRQTVQNTDYTTIKNESQQPEFSVIY